MNKLKLWFKAHPKKTIAGIMVLILVVVLINLPAFFRKEVEVKLLEAIDQNVNAKVTYSELSFSSLKNFPHTTLTFHDIIVAGVATFEKDTLLKSKSLSVSFDIVSLIKGEKIELNAILLDQPNIKVVVTKEGKANYDVMKPSESKDTTSVEIKLDLWKIDHGTIAYYDHAQEQYIEMKDVMHKGKGDFKAERSDLYLFLDVKSMNYKSGNISWFTDKSFLGELVLDMDLKNNIFYFKDHDLKLNHLSFGFNGSIGLPKNGTQFDLTWDLKKSSFSDLLSVLPGFYKEEVKKLNAKGNLGCSGHLKGLLSENSMPSYGVKLAISNGGITYPGLPQSFDQIHLDLTLNNATGEMDSVEVEVKKLTMKMGNHPLSGRLKMKGMKRKYIDAELEGKLKLEELEAFYPLKGIILKGDLYSDITVSGYYDEAKKEMPIIDASLSFEKGYIRDTLYPEALENIEFWATVENKGGSMKDTKISLGKLSFNLEEDTVSISGNIEDLTDPLFELSVDGEVDLEKTLAHFNMQDTKVKGKVLTHFVSSGRWSYIEKKQWQKLTTEGNLEVRNVRIITPALPRKLEIHDALIDFYPDRIQLDTFYSTYGSSKMLFTGDLLDPYAFLVDDKDRVITGDLAMNCDTLNLNEFSVESNNTATTSTASDTSMTAIEIPDHINFVIDSKIKKVIMQGVTLDKLDGEIILKDKTLQLTKASFTMAGAKIECFGEYDTHEPESPYFDMNFIINDMDINRTYKEIPLVQQLAPAAADAHGRLALSYSLKGNLDKNMNVILSSLIGKGYLDIDEANIKGIKMMEAVSKATGRDDLHHQPLKGVFIRSEIVDGKMHLEPFTFTTGRYVLDIEGNHSFENEMNYVLHISVLPLSRVRVPVHITGTVDDYHIKLGTGYDHKSLSEEEANK